MKKLLATAAFATLMAAGVANAGVYVSGNGSYNQGDASIDGTSVSGKSEFGVGAGLGYDHSFGKVYVAGELAMQNKGGELEVTDNADPSLVMKGNIENSRSFNVKLGYEVSPGVTLYGKYGRGNADMKWSMDGMSETVNFDTQTMGAGVMYSLGKSLAITGEYRQLSNTKGTGDLKAQSFDAGLMYRF